MSRREFEALAAFRYTLRKFLAFSEIAAELASRLVQAKLVRRKTDSSDSRRSLIVMTALGNSRLERLARVHLSKLRENKGAFLGLFDIESKSRDERRDGRGGDDAEWRDCVGSTGPKAVDDFFNP